MIPFNTYRLEYDDGDTQTVEIRLEFPEAMEYYLGHKWECGSPDGPEKFHRCTRILKV